MMIFVIRSCLIALLMTTLLSCAHPTASPYVLNYHPSQTQAPRLCGTLFLPPLSIAGIRLGGLSDLAWDEDEQRLYAVADNGHLFHLKPIFTSNRLTDIEVLAAYALRAPNGKPLAANKRLRDAEGLTLSLENNGVRGDSVLLISFERHPRVERYHPDGTWIAHETIPGILTDKAAYRSENQMLEAITLHPRYGLLSTPEQPLRHEADKTLVIYDAQVERWRLSLAPPYNSSVVALEALPDDSILILERAFIFPFLPLTITLRRYFPEQNQIENVFSLSSSQGWRVDNFEGLTRYRALRFLMISDDNFSAAQKTLLTCFEL